MAVLQLGVQENIVEVNRSEWIYVGLCDIRDIDLKKQYRDLERWQLPP